MSTDDRAPVGGRAAEGNRDYVGDGIVVHWNPVICQHSGVCARTLGRVFRPRARPWVQVDQADADTIADAVDHCPSGALSYTRIERRST
ncbi:MAG: (4Fe-4S)-binding protein [Gemmatimonadaceae bacterium]|nr:(4Fe-4S)-binding protein [Gemmatimonadaceae bacterium]